MSVLAVFRWKGDPEQLLRAYDRELEHPVVREQPRRRAHVCAGTAEGMVIVDVWDSEEDFRAMMDDPEFERACGNRGHRSRTRSMSGTFMPQSLEMP